MGIPILRLVRSSLSGFNSLGFDVLHIGMREQKVIRQVSKKSRQNSSPCNFVRCSAADAVRRSGNYKPSVWDFDYIQTLNTQNKTKKLKEVGDELKGRVSVMLDELEGVDELEFIDDLQRLGISYHFEDKIKQILTNTLYLKNNDDDDIPKERVNLYTTALQFRLLRQHGFTVSQDIFNSFMNENGDIKPSLGNDTKGLLQLYEATHFLTEDEHTLEKAREFSTKFLQKRITNNDAEKGQEIDQSLSLLVHNALELPLHWRVQRPNVRWFIDAYERKSNMNPLALELAKMDFDIVQTTYQEELKHVSRWWKSTCLAEKLPFARDRLVECYFWTIGVLEPPQYGYQRIMLTKINALITTIDDVFDVYGTLEELQVFNDAIERWDIESMNQLPYYMQICYLALYNLVHEMSYNVLKEQGFIIIPYLRKSWTDLIHAYLKEAKWYHNGHVPSLEEYMNNAWISISAPVILSHVYFLLTNPIEKLETVDQFLYTYHDIIRSSAMILRLADDLGTSTDEMERGDVPKSIQCYMNETGASEEEAQEHVRFLIRKTWKKMNKELVTNSPFSQAFVRSAVNLGRMAHYMYQNGDGHGIQHPTIMDQIRSSLFEPIA